MAEKIIDNNINLSNLELENINKKNIFKNISVKKIINIFLVGIFFLATVLLSFAHGKIDISGRKVYIIALSAIFAYYLIKNITVKKILYPDVYFIIYGIFILWDVFFRILGVGNPVLFPPLENVFEVFISERVLILQGIGHSLFILVIGFSIAIILGNLLGLIVGWNFRLRSDLEPVAKILSPIPPMVYTPYLIAIMPTFTSASIAVIGLGMFWPTFLSMIQRVNSMSHRILDSAKVMDVSTSTMLFKVILPNSIPSIVGSLKIQLSTVFMILIMAEMIGATSGIGFFIKKYSDYADYTKVLAGIIVVAIVITVLNAIVNLIEKKTIKWKSI